MNRESKNLETIAYFSMEIGIQSQLPSYSGGLGVLAGDTIRSAADLNLPMVAVTLIHHKGYFKQTLDASGQQTEEPETWNNADFLTPIEQEISVEIEGRTVWIKAWRLEVVGIKGHPLPIYFLDCDLEKNSEQDRKLTNSLYGGDDKYRLQQEIILGIGGIRMLRALNYNNINRFHMNEGHSSFLTLELLKENLEDQNNITQEAIDQVRDSCIFTTHTPVPAGHDQYPVGLVKESLGDLPALNDNRTFCCNDQLNMTHLALNLSGFINGVAKKHGEVSRKMFTGFEIDAITNGVHASSWTAPPFHKLFDTILPGWKEDNASLRSALRLKNEELWKAHQLCKEHLFDIIKERNNVQLDPNIFTLGFARRSTGYKRADLLFHDIERLKQIAQKQPVQIVYAGKAHPKDESGKELIKRIFEARDTLKESIQIVYLENYNMDLGQLLTSGVDVWLNTPRAPLEASGTSGMKAALNGVPSLSILDGWWIEGCIEGVTGWSIGNTENPEESDDDKDAISLYEKLEHQVLPAYYNEQNHFINIMKHSIALNGSFFNTQRMMQEYVLKAYFI